MVTNQDGLGTKSFPEETFWPTHEKIVQAFKNESIAFSEILIDKTMPEENAPTRKPGTARLTHYMKGNYDLANSYVIGDRVTDVQLAKNLGAKAIYLSKEKNVRMDSLRSTAVLITESWADIYSFLKNNS